MANAIYPTYKNLILQAGLNLSTSTIKAALISTTTGSTNYTYGSTDAFFSAVASGAIVAAGVALTSKTFTAGAFGAASVTFTSVAQTGSQTVQAVIIYNDTGTASTSNLIAYIDTIGSTAISVTPNGANITLSFSGAVFTLS